MKFFKIITAILAIVAIIAFAGCKSTENEEEKKSTTTTEIAETTENSVDSETNETEKFEEYAITSDFKMMPEGNQQEVIKFYLYNREGYRNLTTRYLLIKGFNNLEAGVYESLEGEKMYKPLIAKYAKDDAFAILYLTAEGDLNRQMILPYTGSKYYGNIHSHREDFENFNIMYKGTDKCIIYDNAKFTIEIWELGIKTKTIKFPENTIYAGWSGEGFLFREGNNLYAWHMESANVELLITGVKEVLDNRYYQNGENPEQPLLRMMNGEVVVFNSSMTEKIQQPNFEKDGDKSPYVPN